MKQTLCLLTVVGLLFASIAFATTPAQTSTVKNRALPVKEVRNFVSAFGQIKNFYVKSVPDKKLFENAIQGMLSGLDPHSSYLNEDDFNNLKSSTTGKFGGLGIEVIPFKGLIKVISPIDDTPASRAGIKPGDLIFKIDGTPVKGLSLQQAVKKMRGDKGSKITLTILRKSNKKPMKITLVRDVIKIKSVKGELLDSKYAYIRISHFQAPTAQNVIKMIAELKGQAHGKLGGLIIDLRNNPGGLLDSAINVADAFLDSNKALAHKKLIVYTKGRIPGAQIQAHAKAGDIMQGAPIVVLINGGSASGSEIVAGALQDHKRAIIIGQQTFGKGSVQTVLPLTANSGIKLTTALYYTPAGRSIQAKGVKPDIKVESIDIPEKNGTLDLVGVRESQLRGHLENKQAKPGKATAKNALVKMDKKALIHRDFQLYEALNLLKALTVTKASIH